MSLKLYFAMFKDIFKPFFDASYGYRLSNAQIYQLGRRDSWRQGYKNVRQSGLEHFICHIFMKCR